jgi:hypothetical protein
MREWCRTRGEDVTRLWRAGEPYAAVDAVVAGVGEYGDPEALARLANVVLAGAYAGDFGVALERAAAFFRVVAAGRRQIPDLDSSSALDEAQLADRNERTAADLSAAARSWRAGTLR